MKARSADLSSCNWHKVKFPVIAKCFLNMNIFCTFHMNHRILFYKKTPDAKFMQYLLDFIVGNVTTTTFFEKSITFVLSESGMF